MSKLNNTIAVAYLARGADKDWFASCERFLRSYKQYDAGIKHHLYIIFKGFEQSADLEKAKMLFSNIAYMPLFLKDDSFDIGAYIEWANLIEEELICMFNTTSEILAEAWLYKLAINLAIPHTGLVGASGSYESLDSYKYNFHPFPNVHIRSNVFMINRRLFCTITQGLEVKSKSNALHFESGPKSLTQQIVSMRKNVLLVGRNGRGYPPPLWPISDTFRQGRQSNLLIADNQTRMFCALPYGEKRLFVMRTWGNYIQNKSTFLKWDL